MANVYPPPVEDSASSDEESFELIDNRTLDDDQVSNQSNESFEMEENRGGRSGVDLGNSPLTFADPIQEEASGNIDMEQLPPAAQVPQSPQSTDGCSSDGESIEMIDDISFGERDQSIDESNGDLFNDPSADPENEVEEDEKESLEQTTLTQLQDERKQASVREKKVRDVIDCVISELNYAGIDDVHKMDKRDVEHLLCEVGTRIAELGKRLYASRGHLKAIADRNSNADAQGKRATRTVTLAKGEKGLFGLVHLSTSITRVLQGGSAEKNGMRRGDQMISIDGINVENFTRNDLEKLFLKARDKGTVTMEICYNPEMLADVLEENYKLALDQKDSLKSREELLTTDIEAMRTQLDGLTTDNDTLKCQLLEAENEIERLDANLAKFEEKNETRVVTLTKGGDGLLGMRRVGSSINMVYEGKPAALNGLQRGDEIISIDGVEIGTLSREEIKFLLRRPAPAVTLVVRYNPERLEVHIAAKSKMAMLGLEDIPSPPSVIQLKTSEDGYFGLYHMGTSINHVNEGGEAERSGVKRGDQLVAIDGCNVETSSEEEISEMFERGRINGGISLVLRHNPERLRDLERY